MLNEYIEMTYPEYDQVWLMDKVTTAMNCVRVVENALMAESEEQRMEEELKFIDDKLFCYTPLPQYGTRIYKTQLVMTKEIFQECYKRWIKPQAINSFIEGMNAASEIINKGNMTESEEDEYVKYNYVV